MASESVAPLASLTVTRIADLHPDIPDPTTRAVRGEITITWPYNSVTNKYAFLVVEPDVLLRRNKGQVRVELCGPAAKALAQSNLGGGDEVIFSLDGVKWTDDESPGRIPGARLQWQLGFSKRLNIQVKFIETGELKHIDIDQPESEPLATLPDTPAVNLEPEPPAPEKQVQTLDSTPSLRKFIEVAPNEYASPALMKRARLSYGSLFEDGLDIFEEDGGARNRGRKRSRFGRDSKAWRYTSQSPEPASPARDAMEVDVTENGQHQQSPKSQMADEACQTVDSDLSPSVTRHAAINPSENLTQPPQQGSEAGLQHVPSAISSIGQEDHMRIPFTESTGDTHKQEEASMGAFRPFPDSVPVQEQPAGPSYQVGTHSSKQESRVPKPDSVPATPDMPPSTLFGTSKPAGPGFSMLGQITPGRAESNHSFAEQVRFGFSHIPQNLGVMQAEAHANFDSTTGSHSADAGNYPDTYLSSPTRPTGYVDTTPHPSTAEAYPQAGLHGEEVAPQAHMTEAFSRSQWDMASQSPSYNPADGGHFGADALNEGTRLTFDEAEARSDPISIQEIPKGFSSYGTLTHAPVEDKRTLPENISPHHAHTDEASGLVENEETFDGSEEEIGVEDEGEVEYDENGEVLEEGDYDQRIYNAPEDDDEGSFVEEDEDDYDEADEYGSNNGWYGEPESDEEDESEEDLGSWFAPPAPANRNPAIPAMPAAPRAAPVVISLLSDDSEDDEAPPPPVRSAPKRDEPIVSPSQPQEAPQTDARDSSLGREAPRIANPGRNHQIQVVDFAQQPGPPTQPQPTHPSTDAEDSDVHETSDTSDLENGEEQLDHESLDNSSSEADEDEGSGVEDLPNAVSPFRQHDNYTAEGESSPFTDKRDKANDGVQDEEDYTSLPEDMSEDDALDGNGPRGLLDEDLEVEEVENPEEVANEQPMTGIEEAANNQLSHDPMEDDRDESLERKRESQEVEDQKDQEMVEAAPILSEKSPDPGFAGQDSGQIEVVEASMEEDTEMAGVDVVAEDDLRKQAPSVETDNTRVIHPSSPPETQTSQLQSMGYQDSHGPHKEPSRVEAMEGGRISLPPTPMESQLTAEIETVSQTVIIEYVDVAESSASLEDGEDPNDPITSDMAEESFQSLPDSEVQEERDSLVEVSEAEEASPVKNEETEAATEPLPEQAAEPVTEEPTNEAVGVPKEEPVQDASSPQNPSETVALAEVADEGSAIDFTADKVQEAVHTDDSLQADTTVVSDVSIEAAGVDAEEAVKPRRETRSSRRRSQARSSEVPEVIEDKITVVTPSTTPRNLRKRHQAMTQEEESPNSPDPSVQLARQALSAKRQVKLPEPLQPTRTSPRITRARSSSVQMSATPDLDDPSVNLARAALASPTRAKAKDAPPTAASLKAELIKKLKTQRECVSVKDIRKHVEEFPTVLAIVTTQPPQPTRAKGGPREYVLSFNITDPSAAPNTVAEVQLYRPHKESLPEVKPGDAILLQKFKVTAQHNNRWSLRTHDDSAWAVWNREHEDQPQIKGPPVENWQQYSDHMKMLSAWWQLLDEGAKGKVERGNRKLAEGGAGGSSQGK